MKWYRTLIFRKHWINLGEDNYNVLNNSEIVSFILDKSRFYGLTIKDIDLSDISYCSIKLFGDKESFLCLVNNFIEEYKKYITDIKF